MSGNTETRRSQALLILASACAGGAAAVAFTRWMSTEREDSTDPTKSAQTEILSWLPGPLVSGVGQALPSSAEHRGCVYLDWNGTTPVFPEVLRAMLPYLSQRFGNPSTSTVYARQCRLAITAARMQVAQFLTAKGNNNTGTPRADQIIFTSCGTEANNAAIRIALIRWKQRADYTLGTRPHIVASVIEHPAITACLDESDCDVTWVPCQPDGRVLADDVIAAIRLGGATALVTLMWANNETGACMPVRQVAVHCAQVGVAFHSDAAQACGKVDVLIGDGPESVPATMVTIVGHKFGAPKGIAALYVNDETEAWSSCTTHSPVSILHGGKQERGWRSGTENTMFIVALGAACRLATLERKALDTHMWMLRSRLLAGLVTHLGGSNVHVNGPVDRAHTLPNTLNVGVKYQGESLKAQAIVAALSDSVALSAGSACHAHDGGDGETGNVVLSPVLKAMGVSVDWGVGSLRLSVGRHTTVADVDKACKEIIGAIEEQKKKK